MPRISVCAPSWNTTKGEATKRKQHQGDAERRSRWRQLRRDDVVRGGRAYGIGKARPRVADDPLRPERQGQDHDDEGQHDAIGREIDEAELLGEPDDQGANRRADDRAHAADNDDDQRRHQIAHVLAGRDRQRRAADHPGQPRKKPADRENADEQQADIDAGRRKHGAIVDAGADHRAELGLVQRKPKADSDDDRRGENDKAV